MVMRCTIQATSGAFFKILAWAILCTVSVAKAHASLKGGTSGLALASMIFLGLVPRAAISNNLKIQCAITI